MNKELEDTALAYILGDLDEAQSRAFEQKLEGDPQLAAHVQELARGHETLALATPEAEAPAHIPDQILAAAKRSGEKETTPHENSKIVSFWSSPAWAVAAGFALCLAAYAFFTLRGEQEQMNRLRRQIATLQESSSVLSNLRVIPFEAQEENFAGSQTVALWDSQKKTAYLVAGSLPDAPHDHAYQIWALDDTQEDPIPGETFASGQEFMAFENFESNPQEERTLRFAVSIEPTGGSPAPTGPVVLVSAEVETRS